MEKETIVILSETAYKILNITYAYDDTDHEYPFCVSTEIRIPKFDGVLTATFNIDYILEKAEKHDKSMVRYVKTMIESYRDDGYWELRAFEVLEEEGFDLKQLMRYSINEITLKFTNNDL
jgi:hypothetical protein